MSLKSRKLGNGRWVLGDCLDALKRLPDNSIDLILCDLPYGTTACKWDSIIPFKPLWEEYNRVCKGPVVLTSTEPFTSKIVLSNIDNFKHKWVWNKRQSGNFVQAKNMPLRICEDIVAFKSKGFRYNPQMELHEKPYMQNRNKNSKEGSAIPVNGMVKRELKTQKYPTDLIEITNSRRGFKRIHPTQKPVALFEYLIKTYSNEGDMVLDNCAGSGTTAIAAINTKRRWLCIEKDKEYSNKALNRIREHLKDANI